MGMSRIE